MIWDFAETNAFSLSTGSWVNAVEWIVRSVSILPSKSKGTVSQNDASAKMLVSQALCSTDPPYYDAIGYADLSDFFYIWAKRSLKNYYDDLLNTLLVPKSREVVAEPFRHGGKQNAQRFFEEQLGNSFSLMRQAQHSEFPLTVYYAFKQAENEGDASATASTGWETMLEGLIKSGFQITGTIPMRTERAGRLRDTGSNALASSIVLVCRPRAEDAPQATRGEFLRALKRELPEALRYLQMSNIAPVDLAQAAIGPGMAVYSRYRQVLESDGTQMRVRAALGIINQILDETLAELDSEYDADTRWAIEWFSQYGMNEGPFGDAETLSKAKNTSVAGMSEAGFIRARAGKVRLLRRDELPADWNPDTDPRLAVWEITQHLIRLLETQGEQAAARVLESEAVGYRGDIAKDLAYRLYNFCERKGWAQDALAYNSLIVSWHDVQKQAAELAQRQAAEQGAFEW
jgi:putative DNA methylase